MMEAVADAQIGHAYVRSPTKPSAKSDASNKRNVEYNTGNMACKYFNQLDERPHEAVIRPNPENRRQFMLITCRHAHRFEDRNT